MWADVPLNHIKIKLCVAASFCGAFFPGNLFPVTLGIVKFVYIDVTSSQDNLELMDPVKTTSFYSPG